MGLENARLENDGQNFLPTLGNITGSGKCRSTSLVEFNLPIQCTSKKLYVVHFNRIPCMSTVFTYELV